MWLACHADYLFRFMADGSTEESELWRCFRDVKPYGKEAKVKTKPVPQTGSSSATAPPVEEQDADEVPAVPTNRKVPSLGLRLLACNISKVAYEFTSKWSSAEWKALYVATPWRKFYDRYIVPLAQLSRVVSSSMSTREGEKEVLNLAKR